MKKYSTIMSKWYEVNNTLYFNGRLPKLKVYWSSLGRVYGRTEFDMNTRRAGFIEINARLKRYHWFYTAMITLVHEMCHVSIGVQGPGGKDNKAANHGDLFETEKKRVIRLGAVDDWV
jgi:hypothetical protein